MNNEQTPENSSNSLSKKGFIVKRQKGDHLIMTKPGINLIKVSPHQVAVTQIMTNLRTPRISRERYFELLEQI